MKIELMPQELLARHEMEWAVARKETAEIGRPSGRSAAGMIGVLSLSGHSSKSAASA